jgi:hypothetical protein
VLASRPLSRAQVLISSNYAEIMQLNRGLSVTDRKTMSRPNIGEALEGFVIKWFLLTGKLGFVVCAFVIA